MARKILVMNNLQNPEFESEARAKALDRLREGRRYIGIDKEKRSVEIATKAVDAFSKKSPSRWIS